MSQELDSLLNAFWLRPETALWRAIDMRAMRDFTFDSPSLDLGAGDGTFSFLRAGGQFAASFDVFQDTTSLEKFFEDVDVYDAFDPSVTADIGCPPNYTIDVAFDHKKNLLSKAKRLGLYREFVEGDANRSLPFDNDSFQSIFSNIVYWLDEPALVLSEISRVLRPGGKACLMLPNITLPQCSFYKRFSGPEWTFLERLDRGRLSDNIKQSKSSEEWERLFEAAGLRVHSHVRHLSQPVVQIWDVGLRPLFPVLMKMVQHIDKSKLPEIKQDWIETMKHFAEPLVDLDSSLGAHAQPAFHCYTLTKA